MSELDYQMALVLQHKYENEGKLQKSNKSDEELARLLQEQFNQEAHIDNPGSNLVYKKPKIVDSSKSLIDPSWELIDPTPDIHTLFIAFNKQFFWNTLGSVTVAWSKRMTSCAGICSYQGRGGLCSITLSEPLLKLRPRKDLVETLLHEMIHAYLFVTSNNRDRDGHGPEFCKHMYRINKESGTSISIYHDFHDEVKLYQQHWWRCNGPCQYKKPFFGMVKRATNRAPGPYDRWFADHSKSCGGTFIKVKEPDPKPKKGANKENVKVNSKSDIRNYFPTSKSKNENKQLNSNSVKKAKSVGGVSKKISKETRTNYEVPSAESYTSDFLSARAHWENKFQSNNTTTGTKRLSSSKEENNKKIPKLSNSPTSSIAVDFIACPNCNAEMLFVELDSHLDGCLKTFIETVDLTKEVDASLLLTKECPLCKSNVIESEFDLHVEQCLHKLFDEAGVASTSKTKDDDEEVACLACGKKIPKGSLSEHLDVCMCDVFQEKDVDSEKTDLCNCPFCLKLISEAEMKEHIDECLRANQDVVDVFSEEL